MFTGELTLQLPPNAVPKRHTFAATDAADADAEFNISLHVLQIFRASVDVIEPTTTTPGQPISLNVSEAHRFLLSLENPGTERTRSCSVRQHAALVNPRHQRCCSLTTTRRKPWEPCQRELVRLMSCSRQKFRL